MIRNNLIKLRAPELDDLDLLYKWENDSSLWYLGDTLVPFSKFILEQYILNNNHDIYLDKQLRLMIEIENNGANITIGAIDLFDFDGNHRRAGIGILIDSAYRKNGYASSALDLILEYAFKTLHLKQVFCSILLKNEESKKLFLRKGFQEIGVRKSWRIINGEWEDEVLYQFMNTNFNL